MVMIKCPQTGRAIPGIRFAESDLESYSAKRESRSPGVSRAGAA